MISVRKANPEDYKLLAQLGRRAFHEAFGEYNDPGDMQAYLDLSFRPDHIRKQLESDDSLFVIASYKDSPVGYAKINFGAVTEQLSGFRCVQLERIYALQAYIGKKVGKSLMESCIEAAKGKDYQKMWLSVWQQNELAINFYKKFGFKIIGFRKFIIGREINEDFVMALDLE